MINKNQKKVLIVILILVHVIAIIGFVNCCNNLKKLRLMLEEKKMTPTSLEEVAEPFKPGEIGEPKEDEEPVVNLPQNISNTIGTIKEIKSDKLIILGNGSNFSDQKPREITLIVIDITSIYDGQKSYEGSEGLKYLKVGDSVSIQAPENIRGKIQFIVNSINKIENL